MLRGQVPTGDATTGGKEESARGADEQRHDEEENCETDEEDERRRVAPDKCVQVAHTSRPRRIPERKKKGRKRHEC